MTGSISTPSEVGFIDAFIEVTPSGSEHKCVVKGTAYVVPLV